MEIAEIFNTNFWLKRACQLSRCQQLSVSKQMSQPLFPVLDANRERLLFSGLWESNFYNRDQELFALFFNNAFNFFILTNSQDLDNHKVLKLCVAAQMYGSGKSKLGSNFVSRLQDPELRQIFIDKLIPSHVEAVAETETHANNYNNFL